MLIYPFREKHPPIFAQKSLGLHRCYLLNSQRNGSHRAGHRLLFSKSAKVHIPSVYTVIELISKHRYIFGGNGDSINRLFFGFSVSIFDSTNLYFGSGYRNSKIIRVYTICSNFLWYLIL